MKEEIRKIVRETLNEDFGGPTDAEKRMLMRSIAQLVQKVKVRGYYTDEELIGELSNMVDGGSDLNEQGEAPAGAQIKDRKTGELVNVKTNMLVQSVEDETSKGKVLNVGVNYDVIPHTNNLNVQWYHGDKAGTKQSVDLDDVVAM